MNNYIRYKIIFISCLVLLGVTVFAQQTNINFIRSWDAVAPENTESNINLATGITRFKMTTQYVDGLGRALQTVSKKSSLQTNPADALSAQLATDIVTTNVYDEFGRESMKYLPFASPANDGFFKQNPLLQQNSFMLSQYGSQGETFFYSKTKFESTPLNRPSESYAAGNSWVGSEATAKRGMKTSYQFNTLADSVRIWTVNNVTNNFGTYATTGVYAAGTLFKIIVADENNRQVIEFKDKHENIILKKVQLAAATDAGTGKGHSGWLCTYYLYDDLYQLRCVVQPRGVELLAINSWNINYSGGVLLNEQCFRYEYDQRHKIIMKKVPGSGIVYMVYDIRDRLVMTQDSVMRALHKWLYTQYDALNRPAVTGLITDNANYNNVAFHRSRADTSIMWPNLASYTNEELTRTFYDDYLWRSTQGNPLSNLRNTASDGYLKAASNTVWPYPQPGTQSAQLKGLVTGTKTKILGTGNTYLYAVNFYDDKGRVIQVQSQNVSGASAVDIITTQYTWSGQPLISVTKNEKAGANPQINIALTQMTYDELGRLSKVEKRVSNSNVARGVMPAAWKLILQNEYDALGQLKKKKLSTAPLDSLNYEYNIRGWILGMNRSYAKDTASTKNWFGFDLGYDKTIFTINGAAKNYTAAQYNGNITGMVWKSNGDDQVRKYDFTYDPVNRLTGADFNQLTNNVFSKSAGIDFSITGLNYDANGNILNMYQKGWKLGGSTMIDSLSYAYISNTNKLLNVLDRKNDTATRLGDFRSSKTYMTALSNNKTTSAIDYTYDGNGNLSVDKNKDISYIHYNHLNLPDSIIVAGKGNIKYVYDAAGNKLKKITSEGTRITTTLYLFGNYVNDTLQFLPHEEGRVRFNAADSTLQYDYFIKDHLGNTRMVLTEKADTNVYPVASLEDNQLSNERKYYSGVDTARVYKNTIPGYLANDIYTSPNDYVQKLNGNGNRIGAGIVLKVMAGDKFNIRVSSWYKSNGVTPGTPVSPLINLVAALTKGVASAATGGAHSFTVPELQTANVLSPNITGFLTDPNKISPVAARPKAYLNWILFDEQMKYVSSSSGAEQVPAETAFGGSVYTHAKSNLPVNKNGYLYIYVSNETPNIDVFFDNLRVTHIRGPLLEETHYYPFGLTMAGISSKAAGKLENHRKFIHQEFNEDLGINLYQFKYRNHDPQIGRFIEIDPLADKYVYNSTYAYAENKVVNGFDLEGLEFWNAVASYGIGNAAAGNYFLGQWMSNKSGEYNEAVNAGARLSIGTSGKESSEHAPPGVGGLVKTAAVINDVTKVVDAVGDAYRVTNTVASILPVGEAGIGIEIIGAASIMKGSAPALEKAAGSEFLYHYTSQEVGSIIAQDGLKVGRSGFSYLTNDASLSPLQAQIELALPANKPLPNSILQIDVSGLNPELIRNVTGNISGFGAGGGTEMLFNKFIPPNLITKIK